MRHCLSRILEAVPGDENLWITEVHPGTGEVEVTNVGAGSVTLDAEFPFCHSFRYNTSIPSGTVFAPGESKVFDVPGISAADSDFWLYRNASFGSSGSIISGLKWGPAPNVGRASVATNAGIWSGAGDFVAAPAAGQSLQLTGADPFSPGNWASGAPNIGTYAPPEQPEPRLVNVRVTFTSNAPENGSFLTPPWVGFHNGGFDSYDGGAPSSPGLERIAEDGNPGPLREEFIASQSGIRDGVLNSAGPLAPGSTVSKVFTIDANSPMSRYFS